MMVRPRYVRILSERQHRWVHSSCEIFRMQLLLRGRMVAEHLRWVMTETHLVQLRPMVGTRPESLLT